MKVFKDTRLLNKEELAPLILISLVKISGESEDVDVDQEKNKIYMDLYFKNTTKDFYKKFEINKKSTEYKDIDVWEPQFQEEDVLLYCSHQTEFYLIHISSLKGFHNDLIDYELENYEKINYLNHINKFVKIEKDILLRNSRRKLFNFCCEQSLWCKYEEDFKAINIPKMGNPQLIVLDHHEFLNDFILDKDKVYYFDNMSPLKEQHLKIYTPKDVYFVTFERESVTFKNQCGYKTLNRLLHRIYGKTSQNFNSMLKFDPLEVVSSGEKLKTKSVKKLNLEQIFK